MAGEAGLVDRSSAPRRVANRTAPERVAVIVGLRQLRMTAAEIAETLAMPLSTVSVVLKRNGVGRLGRIGLEQPIRYERARPGRARPPRSRSSPGSRAASASASAVAHSAAHRPRRIDAAGSSAARSAGSMRVDHGDDSELRPRMQHRLRVLVELGRRVDQSRVDEHGSRRTLDRVRVDRQPLALDGQFAEQEGGDLVQAGLIRRAFRGRAG